MKNGRIVLIALVVASLFCLAFVFRAQTQSRPQWEYRQTCRFDDANKLGAEGWELAAATGSGAVNCLYFKRQK